MSGTINTKPYEQFLKDGRIFLELPDALYGHLFNLLIGINIDTNLRMCLFMTGEFLHGNPGKFLYIFKVTQGISKENFYSLLNILMELQEELNEFTSKPRNTSNNEEYKEKLYDIATKHGLKEV